MEIELQSGSSLGGYQLLARLGRGGMASVWVARARSDADGQRLIAVKAMLPELAHDADFRAMFLEEGQIVRSIEHTNVVRVHGVGEDQGILYMAMEWVEGDSLRTLIRDAKKGTAIPPELAVRILADAAAGLHAAHELRGWDGELRNIVHCDISPHNILVGIDGVPKLVDFGVANATIHSDFGNSERFKGKLGYMSPEQVRAEPLDRRSDVFSLGIVLYELTTGDRLFQGDTAAHTLNLVRSAQIPEFERNHPAYPPKLATIVRRALALDKRQRFQTSLELCAALERYLADEHVAVSRAGVGNLVQRVIGARVEALRQELREALVAHDGRVKTGLLPGAPIPTKSSPNMGHSAIPTKSSPNMGHSAIPTKSSRNMGHSAIPTKSSPNMGRSLLSEPPSAERPSQALSGTPRPETYDTPLPERAGPWPWLSALVGLAAAAGSVLWVTRPLEPLAHYAPAAAGPRPSERLPGRTTVHREVRGSDNTGEASGVDIGSIPLDGKGSSDKGRADARAPREGHARSSSPIVADVNLESPTDKPVSDKPVSDKPSKVVAEKVELAEEPVSLPESPPENPYRAAKAAAAPADAPEAVHGPFNRGAALSQLNASASRAAGCRKPSGPSGSGRATITFGNDGAARGVVISAPFAGTPVGSCVAAAFRGIHVPPFTGSPVTLPWSFRIAE
jgi:serine/threonine protein kinase